MVVLRPYRETLWRRGCLIAALIGVVFLLVAIGVRAPAPLPWYQRVALGTGAPLMRGMLALSRTVGAWFGWGRHGEMAMLQRHIAELEAQLAVAKEAVAERDRLSTLLGVAKANPTGIPALVIGHDPRAEFHTVLIDRGAAEGVTKGMVAVTGAGLVGRVGQVAPHEATVLLLIDPNHAVDVWVQRSRVRGLLVGAGNGATLNRLDGITRLEYLTPDADIVPGDALVTTGLDRRSPKGIAVGTVRSVEHGAPGVYTAAAVVPFVDWGAVEEVLLVRGDQ